LAKPVRALIDGDEVTFKSCVIKPGEVIDWDNGVSSQQENTASMCIQRALSITESWASKVNASESLICFSPDDRSSLFRRAVFVEYKNGRTEKPPFFWEVVAALRERYESVHHEGLEADDVMGINSAETDEYRNVIVSSDKDMKTVPCDLYDPYHDRRRRISLTEANRFWMTQALTGDSTDGYSGCPGIGPKKAEKILEGHVHLRPMWSSVRQAFIDKGFTEAEALKQATLARILRPGDFDRETGEIKWTLPPHTFHTRLNVTDVPQRQY